MPKEEKIKRLPFWMRVRRLCCCDVIKEYEPHYGPFVCLRGMFGKRYYLCTRCFRAMLEEDREFDEWMEEHPDECAKINEKCDEEEK